MIVMIIAVTVYITLTSCQALYNVCFQYHLIVSALAGFLRESIPIRSPGSPRRRKGSGILKEEERTNVLSFFLYIP